MNLTPFCLFGKMNLTPYLDAASIAFEVGYESASQFSREYARLFGMSPIRDAARFRSPKRLEGTAA